MGICSLQIVNSQPGEWKEREACLVLPDLRINSANQRLYNENKASVRIIMSRTKTQIIH